MKHLIAFAVLIGLLTLLTADAPAQQCGHVYRAPVYHAPVHKPVVAVEKVVEVPVFAAVFAPIAIPIPAYSVGYAPGGVDPAMAAELQKLRLEIQQLRGAAPGVPGALPPPGVPGAPGAEPPKDGVAPKDGGAGAAADPSPHAAVMAAKCASCHDRSVATTKGGRFVLTDGGRPVQLSGEDRLEVIHQIEKGYMPKGDKLSDEEFGKLLAGMSAGGKRAGK
jgi:mono/diheme cytochrome c family protein